MIPLLMVSLLTLLAPPDPPSVAISDHQLTAAAQAFAHDPIWVERQFGTPGSSAESSCCRFFGYRSALNIQNRVLIQTYTLVSGGHVAFVYDRLPDQKPWLVVGVVYDAGRNGDLKPITRLLRTVKPTKTLRAACFSFARGLELQTLSTMPLGRTLYVRYLLDHAAAATMTMPALAALRRTDVLQFAYLSFQIGPIIGLSIGDDDFSTSTSDRCINA